MQQTDLYMHCFIAGLGFKLNYLALKMHDILFMACVLKF